MASLIRGVRGKQSGYLYMAGRIGTFAGQSAIAGVESFAAGLKAKG